MKYWAYAEPYHKAGILRGERIITMAEEQILREYYPYWMARMVEKFGLAEVVRNYTVQDCIDDWVVVNWAWETDEQGNAI